MRYQHLFIQVSWTSSGLRACKCRDNTIDSYFVPLRARSGHDSHDPFRLRACPVCNHIALFIASCTLILLVYYCDMEFMLIRSLVMAIRMTLFVENLFESFLVVPDCAYNNSRR